MFSETQFFRQRWLWALLVAVFSIAAYFPLSSGRYGEAATIAAIFLVLGSVLYFVVRLEIRVDDDGVHYRFFPAHLSERTIGFEDIDEFSAGDYSPLREFGGWGMRWRPGTVAFSVSGNECARFQRENEIDIVLGTQNPEEFGEAVRERL